MKIFGKAEGNIYSPEWNKRLNKAHIEFVDLDSWNAQKSRLTATGSEGGEYAIALERGDKLHDGDVLYYSEDDNRAVVVRIDLNDVMVVDLEGLLKFEPSKAVATAIELGHAIGNQHWPAVVRGRTLYVPLTVDRRVMARVMETHAIEGIKYSFQQGNEVVPYLTPSEIRTLFGGAEPRSEHHHDKEYATNRK